MGLLRYSYGLTRAAIDRCDNNEFYLQETPRYKGYTEKIFRLLKRSRQPLTIDEIHKITGIKKRSINGIITFNLSADYIKRYEISSERNVSIPELTLVYNQILRQYFR